MDIKFLEDVEIESQRTIIKRLIEIARSREDGSVPLSVLTSMKPMTNKKLQFQAIVCGSSEDEVRVRLAQIIGNKIIDTKLKHGRFITEVTKLKDIKDLSYAERALSENFVERSCTVINGKYTFIGSNGTFASLEAAVEEVMNYSVRLCVYLED